MKDFNTCFIGISLPEKYQQDFENLLEHLSAKNPLLDTTYEIKTPHITLCFLDKQSQDNLPKIAEDVKKHLGLLKDTHLKVGGMGYFGGDDPRVLFLNVDYPNQLNTFNTEITKELLKYSATDNNLPFHPHLTLAWIETPEAKQSFKENQENIKFLLDKINWEFNLTEITLYGVDSSKTPQYQEKLINIPF